MVTENKLDFTTIEQVIEYVEAGGSCFFEFSTCLYFQSRVFSTVYAGRFFISSERYEEEPRRYTIREVEQNNSINHTGGFMAHATYKDACDYLFNSRNIVANINDKEYTGICEPHPDSVLDPPDGYNGWPNSETWQIPLWVDNEKTLADQIRSLARRQKLTPEIMKEWAINHLTPYLREQNVNTVRLDLKKIDWQAIASWYDDEVSSA